MLFNRETLHDAIENAIPAAFDFYNHGKIAHLQENSATSTDGSGPLGGIAFQIQSLPHADETILEDFDFWVTLLFQDQEDASMYFEVGNIFASRIASTLERLAKVQLRPSHPIALTSTQAQAFSRMPHPDFKQNFGHFFDQSTIPLTLLIVSRFPKEVGNA